jgi:endo-1,4-beta-xylanase
MFRGCWRILSVSAFLAACTVANPQALRQEAERSGVLVGAAVNVRYLDEPAYASTLAQEFNLVEPEDAMKWELLRPALSTFNFADADQIVAFAAAHHMQVRGHNLVWGSHNPKWLTEGPYSPAQLSELLHEHIWQVAGHFRGKVFAWDVVNEAFEEHGRLRSSIWLDQPGIGSTGTDYIAQAFRWAHDADPGALLIYNDAEAEEVNPKSDAIYAMVKDFQRRGIPFGGIGFQMHIYNLAPDVPSIAANFARFSHLGVQIHITEMDVALPVDETGVALHPADLARQAEIYREIAEVCVKTPRCTVLQTWGVTDKYSWLGWATHKTKGAGLLFDRQYRAKPAHDALQEVLNGRGKQLGAPAR